MSKLYIVIELFQYIKIRKKYWLMPIIIMLVLMGLLLVITEGSAIAPFIYVLF